MSCSGPSAPGAPRGLLVVDGPTHIDLYDKPQFVAPAVTKLAAFFSEHLSKGAAK